jgi:hypothetical protein
MTYRGRTLRWLLRVRLRERSTGPRDRGQTTRAKTAAKTAVAHAPECLVRRRFCGRSALRNSISWPRHFVAPAPQQIEQIRQIGYADCPPSTTRVCPVT